MANRWWQSEPCPVCLKEFTPEEEQEQHRYNGDFVHSRCCRHPRCKGSNAKK